MDATTKTTKIDQLNRLRNVRLYQRGAKASATQRKIEALYAELTAAGVTHEEMDSAS